MNGWLHGPVVVPSFAVAVNDVGWSALTAITNPDDPNTAAVSTITGAPVQLELR